MKSIASFDMPTLEFHGTNQAEMKEGLLSHFYTVHLGVHWIRVKVALYRLLYSHHSLFEEGFPRHDYMSQSVLAAATSLW